MSQDRQKKGLLLLERISQDLDTRTSQELPTRACIQAPLRHGICKLLMQGLLREDRGPHQDLHKIFYEGLAQDYAMTSYRGM